MTLPELITSLMDEDLTTAEMMAIMLFVASYGEYKFHCCHRRAFIVYQCPVTLNYSMS